MIDTSLNPFVIEKLKLSKNKLNSQIFSFIFN